MRAGAEEVAAELGHRFLRRAEAVHAVHDQQHPLRFGTLFVGFLDRLRDPAHRQSDSGAGVDPGDPEHAGRRSDGLADAVDDSVGGRGRGVVEQSELPHRRAVALGRKPDRLVVDDVVVGGDEDFVARLERQAVVDEGQAGGGVRRQRDLILRHAEIGGSVFAHLALHVQRLALEHPALDGQERVVVERRAEGLDGVPDRSRMRDDVKASHVDVARRKPELCPYAGPVIEARRAWSARFDRREQPARQEQRRAVEREKTTTRRMWHEGPQGRRGPSYAFSSC